MKPEREQVEKWAQVLAPRTRERIQKTVAEITKTKESGGRVVVVTGSGPNIHEGVTTLIAEFIGKGIVDGVITSSAVVAHEMAGTLDRVRRVKAGGHGDAGIPRDILPKGDVFEVTLLTEAQRRELQREIGDGWELYDRLAQASGDVILKAAGNMAWPVGPRTELLAREAEELAKQLATTVEYVAGLGADPRTMIGAAARQAIPVVVSIPQLIGGGGAGLAIGDAIPISRRASLVADVLASAGVIIESAIALSQEIHDGPFELYTGHGIWAARRNLATYSLQGKTLIRIDLDSNLELAWQQERSGSQIQHAVDRGLPKTKLTGIPFRMEMSGFARLEGSIPIIADIGVVWPCIAAGLEETLGVELDFISAPQESPEGRRMRNWIADEIRFVDRQQMRDAIRCH